MSERRQALSYSPENKCKGQVGTMASVFAMPRGLGASQAMETENTTERARRHFIQSVFHMPECFPWSAASLSWKVLFLALSPCGLCMCETVLHTFQGPGSELSSFLSGYSCQPLSPAAVRAKQPFDTFTDAEVFWKGDPVRMAQQ